MAGETPRAHAHSQRIALAQTGRQPAAPPALAAPRSGRLPELAHLAPQLDPDLKYYRNTVATAARPGTVPRVAPHTGAIAVDGSAAPLPVAAGGAAIVIARAEEVHAGVEAAVRAAAAGAPRPLQVAADPRDLVQRVRALLDSNVTRKRLSREQAQQVPVTVLPLGPPPILAAVKPADPPVLVDPAAFLDAPDDLVDSLLETSALETPSIESRADAAPDFEDDVDEELPPPLPPPAEAPDAGAGTPEAPDAGEGEGEAPDAGERQEADADETGDDEPAERGAAATAAADAGRAKGRHRGRGAGR
jgi:hypothetical protein